MFRRILVATDGSKLSAPAVSYAIALARAVEAQLIAVHALPSYRFASGFDEKLRDSARRRAYEAVAANEAGRVLEPVRSDALAAQVECTIVHELADAPWRAIIAAADKSDADVIVMASHGRRGLSAMLIGSETQHVLTHSRLPVLVVR